MVAKAPCLIYQGDVLETGAKASIGIVFADDTTFSLGEEGRMTLDEMVYDPDNQSGSFGATVLTGTFPFVSGEIAKTFPRKGTNTSCLDLEACR